VANPNHEDRETRIAGITVELMFERYRDEFSSSCHLSIRTRDGEYKGSLPLCEDMGGIPYEEGTGPDDGPELYPLSAATLDKITAWAESNGY
jgi:hypothetical protein